MLVILVEGDSQVDSDELDRTVVTRVEACVEDAIVGGPLGVCLLYVTDVVVVVERVLEEELCPLPVDRTEVVVSYWIDDREDVTVADDCKTLDEVVVPIGLSELDRVREREAEFVGGDIELEVEDVVTVVLSLVKSGS